MARDWRAPLRGKLIVEQDRPRPQVALIGLAAAVVLAAFTVGLRLAGAGTGTCLLVLMLAGLVVVFLVRRSAFAPRPFQSGYHLTIAGLALWIIGPGLLAVLDAHLFGPVVDVDVAHAMEVASAAGFTFRDGILRDDLIGYPGSRSPGRTRDKSYVVAPVTAADGKSGDQITVWAVEKGSTPPPAWSAPGGLIRSYPDADIDEAIAVASQRLNLVSAPEPVIGRWVADPRAEQVRMWLTGAIALILLYLVWAVIALFSVRRP